VNVPGIDTHAVARGEALVAPREFTPVSDLRVDFTPLPAALGMLKRRTPVRAHIGSAEIPGTLVFETKPPSDAIATPARLLLQRPTVFYPGSRLIVRRMSPKDLLGGAIARAPGAGAGAFDPHEVAADSLFDRILAILSAARLNALEMPAVAAAANIVATAAQAALDQLCADGRVVQLHKPAAFVARSAFDAALARLAQALTERHRQKSWSLGITSREAATVLELDEPRAVRLLAAWSDDGRLAQTGRLWHLPGMTPELTAAQRTFLSSALREDPVAPLLPHSYDDVVQQAGTSGVPGILDAIETLLVTGGLVRIGNDLYRRAQIERARGLLVTLLQDGANATMAQVRDAFGTSRRHALPLMEHFDAAGLTVRDGDLRRLRKVARPAAT
jgi:selenocysteine-specific elongation factor